MIDNNELKNSEKRTQPQALFGGLFMIALGILYFLPTLGIISWQSIGFFFLLIPVAAVSYGAWMAYQEDGRLSGRVITRLMWGLFPFAFMGLWYAGFNIGNLWPLVLIFIGVTMLVNQGYND